MRSVAFLAAMALTAVVLAGCSNEDPERFPNGGPTGSTSTSRAATSGSTASEGRSASSSSSTGSATGGPGPAGDNQPPTGSVNVDVNGTNATFTLAGSDPDGDALTWELDFGDGNATNGTKLPTTVVHAYAAGNYTAVLTVSDGAENATSSVAVAAAAAAATPFAPIHQEGAVTILCVQCSQEYNTCAGLAAETSGVDCFFFALAPEAAGHTATISSSNGFVNVDVMADCSGMGAGLYSYLDEAGTSPYSFEIPAGAGCILMYEWADIPPSLTVDIA